MNSQKLLYEWIQKNHKVIWPERKEVPRILGRNALFAEQMHSFSVYAQALVSRLWSLVPVGSRLPIEIGILNLGYANAWVVWPGHFYGIFVTKALLWKIQRISGEAPDFMRKGREIAVELNYLRQLWGELPEDDQHFHHFGSLIAHIAFAFVIHHELAHAGLGHEGAIRLFGEEKEDQSGQDGYFQEISSVARGGNLTARMLRNQALETDADVHAMLYTRRMLDEEAQVIRVPGFENQGALHRVWGTLLRDDDIKQLILFIGTAVGLLSLLPDLVSDRFDASLQGTHPVIPSRLLLLLHSAGSIGGYGESYWRNRSAAVSAAITMISLYQKHDGISVDADQRSDPIPQKEAEGKSGWDTIRHLSIVDAMRRSNELGEHWEQLVEEVHRVIPKLGGLARFPKSMRYDWYKPGTIGEATGR